ncbi:MAG TPA: type III pantothenate kinase [Candidatus Limadaptatus stercoripullorum]|uniref:Type III pantothenate kinase n=1 Tax=Candidatus Limadaptatus stercoripullorum TaxID=2840846 RepID=A0A9D1SVP9_9FIRM|nr:type III pantothenate kinase [Candidatus Limadaptatus stercoripullorum]
MLLAMDIGNTNVKIGIFKGDKLASTWRVSTVASHTADEYGMVIYDLLRQSGARFEDIKGSVMSSVAPSLNYTIEHMCTYYMGKKPLVVDHRTELGIKVRYENPAELGADRMVGAAAAYKFYGGPVIEVDFGSATTFNLVTAEGEFIGGAIAPGIKTATESLVHTAAKLPRIELAAPPDIVGTSTRSCMQAGIVYGYAGLVKYLVGKYRELPEMKGAKVVATGGLGELIGTVEPDIADITDRALALKGLKYIYDINR